MVSINYIEFAGIGYTNWSLSGRDKHLFEQALGIHSIAELEEAIEELIVRIQLPNDALIDCIQAEVRRFLARDNYYDDLNATLQKQGDFNLKLVAEAICNRIDYSYRSIGRAVKLTLMVGALWGVANKNTLYLI